MKNLFLALILLITFSCTEKGVTKTVFNGGIESEKLPTELKDLKLYWVETSNGLGSGVYVGFMDGYKSTSTTLPGKSQVTVVLLSKNKERTIYAKEILSETDSIIVIRK